MTTGIDGLVSGLDTTSLINSLISAEATPQTLLKNKVTSTTTFITALQSLNSKIADLATKATVAAKPASLDTFQAGTSDASVTATATTGARAGTLTFAVDAVAQTQVGVSAAMTSWSSNAPTITVVSSTGQKTEISPASGSLDDVASAINSSASGVKATKVQAGVAADGTRQYRLQLTSGTSGAAGAFSIYRGSASDVDAGTATDVLHEQGAAVVAAAQDAQVTLWSGTAAEQKVTSATNTFANLLTGVSVTVSKPSSDPVTLTVARDTDGATGVASGLVSTLNSILSSYATSTAVSSSTSSAGTSTTSAGTLTGDSASRSAVQALTTALSAPVNGRSPSSIGIQITRDGNFTFDADAFQAALASDPDAVQSTLSTIAGRVASAATSASDKYTGTLTQVITGQQSVVKDLGTQISDWDDRLAIRRASLTTIYSNLEVQLAQLQSQSSWLSSQVASLTSS